MSLVLVIYLIEVIFPVIPPIFGGLCLFSGVYTLFYLLFGFCMYCDGRTETKQYQTLQKVNYLKTCYILCIVFGVLAVLTPSRQTSYILLATYGVTEVVKNKDVQRLGGKSFELLEGYIDKHLKELDNEKELIQNKGVQVDGEKSI